MTNVMPAAILLAGVVLVPFFRGRSQNVITVALPAIAFWVISQLEPGSSMHVHFFGHDLTLMCAWTSCPRYSATSSP